MPSIAALILSIPDVIWSGVIASLLTLGGVLISNRSNTNRLLIQLKHDANEKSKERTAALRRDVYLKAAEELTKANSHLGSLAQADLAKTNATEGLQGFFAPAAKLQLIAEPKTALLVGEVAGAYGELLLKLLARLVPLQRIRSDISSHEKIYEDAHAEVKRVLSEMTKFNESAQSNESVFRALQSSFDFHQSNAKAQTALLSELGAQYTRMTVDFGRSLLIDMRDITARQIPMNVEIRKDLGLAGDLSEFEAQMKAQWERMSKQVDLTLSGLSAG
jgi:hypothetical protein